MYVFFLRMENLTILYISIIRFWVYSNSLERETLRVTKRVVFRKPFFDVKSEVMLKNNKLGKLVRIYTDRLPLV
jgi:hypothetical protein